MSPYNYHIDEYDDTFFDVADDWAEHERNWDDEQQDYLARVAESGQAF